MVAEEDELVGLHIVHAVGHLDGRGLAVITDAQYLLGDEQAVVAVGQSKNTQGDKYQRQCIHLFLLKKKISLLRFAVMGYGCVFCGEGFLFEYVVVKPWKQLCDAVYACLILKTTKIVDEYDGREPIGSNR